MTVDVLLHRRLLDLFALFGCPPFVVHAFAGIACDIAMPESTRQRLIQCAQIVKTRLARPLREWRNDDIPTSWRSHPRTPPWKRPGTHHQQYWKCHSIRCVTAPVQAQALGDIIHGRSAGAHIADTAHFAALHRLPGIVVGTVQELLFASPAGRANVHSTAAQSAEPRFQLLTPAGSMGTITSRGTGEMGASKSARPVCP